MKALITGGAGFIGSHLAEKLIEKGLEVTAIDDLSTGSLENIQNLIDKKKKFHFVVETIQNELVMDRLVSEADVVYHLAAAVGVKLIVEKPVHVIETNILGSRVVLKLANRYKKKVLITSTSEIYGKSTDVPFKEESDNVYGATINSRWCYAFSKAIDEFLALAYAKEANLSTVIVRLFNTVGPKQTGQYGMVIPRFVSQALKGEPISVYGDGTQSRCFTYVGDIVEALIKLMECKAAEGNIFNLGSTEEISIYQLAEKIKSKTKSTSEIKRIPYDEAYAKGFEDMHRRIPDISKAEKYIHYQPKTSLDEILNKVILFHQGKNR